MSDVNVNDTAEATYVRSLKWEYDGFYYTCRGMTETLKDKLKTIFDAWKIGFNVDKVDCKPGFMNLNVTQRQFKRVQFAFDPSKITYTKGATIENL